MSLKKWVEAIDHPGLSVNEYGVPALVTITVEEYEEARVSAIAFDEALRDVRRLEAELAREREL